MFNSGYLERASEKIDKCLWKYQGTSWRGNLSFFAWSFGELFRRRPKMKPKADSICRMTFILGGGIGDMLISLNYLNNLNDYFIESSTENSLEDSQKIDQKANHHEQDWTITPWYNDKFLEELKGLSAQQSFIQSVQSERRIQRDADLIVELFRFPKILYYNRPKIVRLSKRIADWADQVERFQNDFPYYYRSSTPADFLGMQYTLFNGRTRLQQADIGDILHVHSKLQLIPFADIEATLAKFSLKNCRFMTFQRGVGGRDANHSTKLWPMEHYQRLVSLLHTRFPDLMTVQLGTENNDPIPGVRVDLRGKTTFEELKVLLHMSDCHLDGECGMVHLRHFLKGGASVVLFGSTSEQFYGYPENINLRSDICSGGCEWLIKGYERRCVRGFEVHQCLSQLAPEIVMEKISEVLNEKLL